MEVRKHHYHLESRKSQSLSFSFGIFGFGKNILVSVISLVMSPGDLDMIDFTTWRLLKIILTRIKLGITSCKLLTTNCKLQISSWQRWPQARKYEGGRIWINPSNVKVSQSKTRMNNCTWSNNHLWSIDLWSSRTIDHPTSTKPTVSLWCDHCLFACQRPAAIF